MDDNIFSIVMFIVGGAILLSAGIIRLSKSTELIPRSQFAKIEDKQAYAVQFSKLLALIGCAPVIGGLVGLTGIIPLGLAAGGAALVGAIIAGVKITKKVM